MLAGVNATTERARGQSCLPTDGPSAQRTHSQFGPRDRFLIRPVGRHGLFFLSDSDLPSHMSDKTVSCPVAS